MGSIIVSQSPPREYSSSTSSSSDADLSRAPLPAMREMDELVHGAKLLLEYLNEANSTQDAHYYRMRAGIWCESHHETMGYRQVTRSKLILDCHPNLFNLKVRCTERAKFDPDASEPWTAYKHSRPKDDDDDDNDVNDDDDSQQDEQRESKRRRLDDGLYSPSRPTDEKPIDSNGEKPIDSEGQQSSDGVDAQGPLMLSHAEAEDLIHAVEKRMKTRTKEPKHSVSITDLRRTPLIRRLPEVLCNLANLTRKELEDANCFAEPGDLEDHPIYGEAIKAWKAHLARERGRTKREGQQDLPEVIYKGLTDRQLRSLRQWKLGK